MEFAGRHGWNKHNHGHYGLKWNKPSSCSELQMKDEDGDDNPVNTPK